MFYEDDSSINNYQIGDYLEINIDETINRNGQHAIPMNLSEAKNVVRKFGSSMTTTRNAMVNASSVNATALAVTQDLADRVDRGERSHFKYEIEDNGVKHN